MGSPRVRAAGPVQAWEWAALSLALLAAWHFLSLRIAASSRPQGDEGSWLSVAAELSRGHGFTTRWLELHFLRPYAVPRPDDFRYPGLTGLLALVFRFTGVSWRAAQWTVTCVFLLSVSASWLAVRRAFGAWTALAAAFLACFSLLQLQWGSMVYTEGLFGLVLAGLFLAALTGNPASRLWWLRLGAGVGLLYLVRPNGILFAPGIAWLYLRLRPRVRWDRPLWACAAMGAVMAPWLWRTWIRFGNPFHLAGSAGMLRNTRAEPSTYGLLDYLRVHGALFPLRRTAVGVWGFFRTLQFYEHGLQYLPLLLVLAALLRRRPFYHPFLACGFALSFAAFAYASFNSWAGARYAAPLLPFVYAYGLSQLPGWWKSAAHLVAAAWVSFESRIANVTAGASVILLLLLPVCRPHRFYERSLVPSDAGAAISDHVRRVRALVPEDGSYYAGSLAPLNFLAERNCVGLQELNDSTWFARSRAAMHPGWLALAHGEESDPAMAAAIGRMRKEGFELDTVDEGSAGVYLQLRELKIRN
jgi:hypothetical protein